MIELLKRLHHGVKSSELDEAGLFDKLSPFLQKSKNSYKLQDNLIIGKVDINRSQIGFLTPLDSEGGKDLIIESRDLNGAMKKDIVLAKRLKRSRGREACAVLSVIKRFKESSICVLKEEKGVKYAFDIISKMPIPLNIPKKSLKPLPVGTVCRVNLNSGELDEILGHIDSSLVDEKICLALYNKKEEFSKEASTEAKAFGVEVFAELYPNRVDLRDLNFCTIDPASAKDHDDAIYFDEKEKIIYVAIADVSEYVTSFSAIDKEAKKRGFSIYLPHKSIPMLPRELSENICSLKEGRDRLAYVFKIKIDTKTYGVEKSELFEAIINSKKGFNYDEVDEFLEDKKKLRYFSANLKKLYALTSKIRKKRVEGAFEFEGSDTRLLLDENQNLIDISVEKETPSHKLVEECMLLANIEASKFFDFGIFRVHEKPDEKRLEELLVSLANIGIAPKISSDVLSVISFAQKEADRLGLRNEVDTMIIKSLKQARYDAQNMGHFGLGFESYTHFTSPIRRYSDLILHRLLKAITAKDEKAKKFILKDIKEVAAKVSDLERESAKVEWDYADRKYARWAREHKGESLEVTITDLDYPAIGSVKSKIYGARVFVKDRVEFYLFDKIKAKIAEVDIESAKIYVKAEEMIGETL